jgi:alpha-ketoglutarate-dependent taurine dioxygenase
MAGTAVPDLSLSRDDVRAILRGASSTREREVAERLRRLCDTQVRAGRGFAVVAGPADLARGEARDLTLAASRILGRVMPQDFLGEQVREVRDRGLDIETNPAARYSDTRFGGHLHTDGMHRPGHIPDLFALYCHRPAKRGGDSVFVHVDDILARLEHDPRVVEALSGWFHFDTRDTSGRFPRTVRRQIIEDGARINYLREYVESGHSTDGVPALTAAQRAALDAVDRILADPALTRHARLDQGQLMIINNRRLVHGRTGFVDFPDPENARLLFRTWIDTRQDGEPAGVAAE